MKKIPRHTGTKALKWCLTNRMIKDWRRAIDGGACKGEWTRRLGCLFEKVDCFEPEPSSLHFLYDAIRRRGFKNVSVNEYALMERSGEIIVYAPGKRQTLTARRVQWPASAKGDEQSVVRASAVDLDSFRFDDVGLVKLDLEGAEPLAILGARETLRKCSPVLIVEINGQAKRFGYTDRETIELIGSLGYRHVQQVEVDGVFVR